jgi:hypothetical protein
MWIFKFPIIRKTGKVPGAQNHFGDYAFTRRWPVLKLAFLSRD